MGTDVIVIIERGQSLNDVEDVPDRLNARFDDRRGRIQLRRELGYRGEVVFENGEWVWREEILEGDEDDGDSPWAPAPAREWQWHRREVQPSHALASIPPGAEPPTRGLSGPFGLDLYVERTAVTLSTGIPWEHLVFHDAVRSDLRGVARAIAEVVGGSKAIFLPDDIQPYCDVEDALGSYRTFGEMESLLRAHEEPAETFRDMVTTAEVAGRLCCKAAGYFIDRFETTG